MSDNSNINNKDNNDDINSIYQINNNANINNNINNKNPKPKGSQSLSLILGGLLPIIAFTVVEELYGPVWGTIVAMIFGVGEIVYEKWKFKKISKLTLLSNTLVLVLGLISIFFQEGIWFKLQPAILELFMAIFLWYTTWTGQPFLSEMAFKQNPNLPPQMLPFLRAVNFRLGFFFLGHAVIATWAALSWSTTAWAFLKGIGLTVSMIVYMVIEMIIFRKKLNP